jgi:hypothetical protein
MREARREASGEHWAANLPKSGEQENPNVLAWASPVPCPAQVPSSDLTPEELIARREATQADLAALLRFYEEDATALERAYLEARSRGVEPADALREVGADWSLHQAVDRKLRRRPLGRRAGG